MVSAFLALLHLKLRALLLRRIQEEVANLFVVDFDERALQVHLPSLAFLRHLEKLAEGAPVNASILRTALHGVRLPGARLAVSEDADVVAVDHRHDQIADASKEHCLRGLHVVHLVERPGLFRCVGLVINLDLASRRKGDAASRFSFVERPTTAVDADVAFQLLHKVVKLTAFVALRHVLLLPLLRSGLCELLQLLHLAPQDLFERRGQLLHFCMHRRPKLRDLLPLRAQGRPNPPNKFRGKLFPLGHLRR
mmetsp:Transcript_118428/g.334819  ORF Transcript_118428/g.334819 Transcript_118428/m.334819 type:complete len:251 (+) Transcript_118428:626-1378(+)